MPQRGWLARAGSARRERETRSCSAAAASCRWCHFNLHLDHESQPSRERSTLLLKQRIESRAFSAEPVIVSGDFNVGDRYPALVSLVGGEAGAAAAFVDTYRVRYPDAATVGTFTGSSSRHNRRKIDYVLVQPGTEVLSADIIRTSRNNRYPSDHFPVVARVRLAQ
jgi:endonuclease/exonuclease/phosphatase family metal-dependent hydrolase